MTQTTLTDSFTGTLTSTKKDASGYLELTSTTTTATSIGAIAATYTLYSGANVRVLGVANGKIYWINYSSKVVESYDIASGTSTTLWTSYYGYPRGGAIDVANNVVYIAASTHVASYTLEGGNGTKLTDFTVAYDYGMDFDGTYIYVVDGSHTVNKYSKTGTLVSTITLTTQDGNNVMNAAKDIAYDPSGPYLMAVDSGNYETFRWNMNGTVAKSWPALTQSNGVYSLTFASGSLYIGDTNAGTANRHDISTTTVAASGTQVSAPFSIPYSKIGSSTISWTATTPTNSSVDVSVSVDGGNTYVSATNGGSIPGLADGVGSIILKETLSQTGNQTPVLQPITMTVTKLQVTVTPQQPSRSGNVLTIPTQTGVVYEHDDGDSTNPTWTTVTGTWTIPSGASFNFKAIADTSDPSTDYVLQGTTSWQYMFQVTTVYVTPQSPTRDVSNDAVINTVNIPTQTGVVYQVQQPGDPTWYTVSGAYTLPNADGAVNFKAIPSTADGSTQYVLQGTTTWVYYYAFETQETDTTPIPYDTQRIADDTMETGTETVVTPGQDGVETEVFNVWTANGVLLHKTLASDTITPAVTEVIHYGVQAAPVTATEPVRNGNTITIPDVTGVDYVDMTGGTKTSQAPEAIDGTAFTAMDVATPAPDGTAVVLAPGDYTVNSTTVIGVQAQAGFVLTNPTTTWPYTKYASIIPQKPDEYDHYIVIPTVDGIEYYDGATGVVYPVGTQRQIGASLTIHTRLTVENAILTNDAASWTFTRTGGVTAIKPESLSTFSFVIPFNDQLQYINKDTGEVLHNNSTDGTYYDVHLANSPTGLLNVTAQPLGSNFLTNPYDVWTWGEFDKGLEFLVNLDELDITTGRSTPVDVSTHFSDYLEIYINGEQYTANQSPAIYGDIVMELKLRKDTGLNRLAVDWNRGDQNEPTGVYWTNFDDNNHLADPAPPFEWTGDDTLKTPTFTWVQGNPLARLYVPLREIDKKTYGKHTLVVAATLGVNQYLDAALDADVFSSGNAELWGMDLWPTDWAPYFDLLIDGVKQEPSVFKNFSSYNGSAESADIWSTMDITSGYHEFRLILNNPDLIWENFFAARSTGLYLDGPDGFRVSFDPDANGDLVWSGVWPDSVQSGTLLIFPYEPDQAVIDLLPKTDPTYDPTNAIVTIPDPYPGIVEYADASTGKVIPPGPFQLTRYTEIIDRIVWTNRFKKVNGQYYIYQIDHDYRYWRYDFSVTQGVFYVTAAPPTQVGTIVTIPDDDNVLYWDSIGRRYVTGTIDFLDLEAAYNQTAMRIKPIPKYATYRLTNPNDVWAYTSNLDVYSVAPTQVDNDITIPSVPGIQYINKATGVVLTGTVHITADIVIDAQAIAPYNLRSLVNEWTFKWVLIQAKWVTATDPTVNGNWVTIPTVEGVQYINTATGTVVTGTIYVKDTITIGVEAVSERYAITNATATWSYTNVPVAGEKEVVIVDADPRLVVYVDGSLMAGSVFTVAVGSSVSIDMSLLQDSEFSAAPYLLDSTNTQTPFTLSVNNTVATLDSVTFADNTPIELHIGAITQLTRPIYFTGVNTSLQVKQGGTLITTMTPGSTSKLTVNDTYDFQVIPDTGYDFDRPGQYETNGATVPIIATLGQAVTFTIADVQAAVYVDMSAIQLTVPTSSASTGFNNVYVASYDDLSLISKEMLTKRRDFVLNNPNAGMSYLAQVETNPQEFIINTISVPFAIPAESIASHERIMLGYTELFTSADRLGSTLIKLDLGQIYTAPKYNNSYDFANTMVNLHLPYADPITIDATYAIGQTLSLEYYVDAFTGYATINVRSSLVNDNIIYSLHVLVANDVPFISMRNGSVQGGVESIRSKLLNNTPTPFLEVLRNVPYQIDSPFNNIIQDNVDGLDGITGYVSFANVRLNLTTATTDEESQLRQILAAGILIK